MAMRVNKSLIIWSIIGTGISSITVQLVTVREFLTQFQGNEITISLVLFVWLLLNGAGSHASRIFRVSRAVSYSLLIFFIAVWPLLQIIIIRYFRDMVILHGASPGFYQILFYITVTTAPYAFLTGYILPGALDLLKSNYYDFTSGELYLTDSAGDILGGAVFSFFLVYWLNPFKTIAVTSSLLILISFNLLIKRKKSRAVIVLLFITAMFYVCSLNSGIEKMTMKHQYGDVIRYKETPMGRLVITREASQHTFWESGVPLYSDDDITGSEEKIHYPMCQLGHKIKNVLLISGGIGGTLPELYKYNPEKIDYVELDPALTKMALESGLLKPDPRLNIINLDGRSYLKTAKTKYDAIIMDLPDPDTFQVNRFFTSEFFRSASEKLNENGVLSFNVKSYENYISDIVKSKLSSIYNTVGEYFSNVIMVPGSNVYFVCSNRELSYEIPERLAEKGIGTRYIQYYFHGNVSRERISQLAESLDAEEFINTDYEPRLLNIAFKDWFSKHGTSPNIFLIAVLAAVFIYIIFMKKEEYILFSSGIACMAVEMLVIYSFQIMYGYVYSKIGLLITAFLFGLLPGAAFGSAFRQKNYSELILSEIFILVLLIGYYVWVSFFKTDLSQVWFISYSILFSAFCGFQFPVVTGIIGEKMSPAAGCLAADLAGAAVGTLLAGTLLIPLAGIQAAIITVIVIKITSALIIIKGGRN